jgi:dTDP-4-dehydrorhamnose reductase
MRILITGSNGLLGQKIVKRCLKHKIPFVATSKGENRNPDCPSEHYVEMDICDQNSIEATLTQTNPTAVIHTAAITNVDACELNPVECKQTNVTAVESLFHACRLRGIHFQLLSTDFVFDGESGNYSEEDEINPLSQYAHSKADAEAILKESSYTNWSISRTIIVYGTAHNLSRSNLILWALEALPKQETMRLVNDQFRAPTWADDLAYGCVEIVLRKLNGIFHLSGPCTRSVDKIVLEIASLLNINQVAIETISSSTLNQPAKRPPKTGFNLTKAKQLLDYQPKDLDQTIPLLLQELAHTSTK